MASRQVNTPLLGSPGGPAAQILLPRASGPPSLSDQRKAAAMRLLAAALLIALLLLFVVGHSKDANVTRTLLRFHCRQDHTGSASEPLSAASASKAPAAVGLPEPSIADAILCIPSGSDKASAPAPAAAAAAGILGRRGVTQILNVLPSHAMQSHRGGGKEVHAPSPAPGTTTLTGASEVLGKSKEHLATHVAQAHVQTPALLPAPSAKGAKRVWSVLSLLGTGKKALAEEAVATGSIKTPDANSNNTAFLHQVAMRGTDNSAAGLGSPLTSREASSTSRTGLGTAVWALVPSATSLGWDGKVVRAQHTGAKAGRAPAPAPSAARRQPTGEHHHHHLSTTTTRTGGVPTAALAPAPMAAWAGRAARGPAQDHAQPLSLASLRSLFG